MKKYLKILNFYSKYLRSNKMSLELNQIHLGIVGVMFI